MVHPSSATTAAATSATRPSRPTSTSTVSPGSRSHCGTEMLSSCASSVGQMLPSSSRGCMCVSAPCASYTRSTPTPSVRSQCPSMLEVTALVPHGGPGPYTL
eukprot:4037543-Prymnesium_polylepis.1